MKIGIALVTFNNTEDQIHDLTMCIKGLNYEYLVVYDNSPTNKLKNIFNDLGWVYLFENGENLGFGKAHNFIFNKFGDKSDLHLIINPDIKFDYKILHILSNFLNTTPNAGCVMPKVLYPNGEIQYLAKYLPSIFDMILRRVPITYIKSYVNKKLELRKFYNQNLAFKAPFLSGCFLLFKSEVIKKVGFFDERYFLYAEDLDLTRRLWISNYFPYCLTEVFIYHSYEKASSKNYKLFFKHIISLIKYFYKWGIFDSKKKYINKLCLNQFIQ